MGLESLEQYKKDLIKLANLKFKVAIFLVGVLILFAPPGDFSTFSIRHTINRKTPLTCGVFKCILCPLTCGDVQAYTTTPHPWGVQAYTALANTMPNYCSNNYFFWHETIFEYFDIILWTTKERSV